MKISNQGDVEIPPSDVIEVATAFFGFFKFWKKSRLPKNKKDKIGIVIAIRVTNDSDRVKLENDLILEIKQYLKASKTDEEFNIIYCPKQISDKITDEQIANKYLEKAKAHLIVYGLMEQGKIGGDNKYIFKLDGVVRHAPISGLMGKTFASEFRDLLPKKMIFSENDEVLGFELTEKCLKYAIKYIIAIASFVSGDLVLAETLNLELKKDIETTENYTNIAVLNIIIKRIPKRITEIMATYIGIYYSLFSVKRNPELIINCKKYLDVMSETDPDNYSAHLCRSIYYFFIKDIPRAIEELRHVENHDPTYRLNLGFLLAYSGDINGALSNYKKTFYTPTYGNIYNDTEIFISEVIKKEPDKIQLHFFRGIINHKLKNDNKLAKEDFLYFIKNKKKNEFQRLGNLAIKYLDIIERRK